MKVNSGLTLLYLNRLRVIDRLPAAADAAPWLREPVKPHRCHHVAGVELVEHAPELRAAGLRGMRDPLR